MRWWWDHPLSSSGHPTVSLAAIRYLLTVWLVAALAFSCTRADEARRNASVPSAEPDTGGVSSKMSSSSASGSAEDAATAAADAKAAGAKPCLHPMPAEPPPRAELVSPKQCPDDPALANPAVAPELKRQFLTFVDAPSKPRVEVELARTPAQRSRGLMFRTSLGEDSGMLFSWNRAAPRSFWMRNTCLPLDMFFIAPDFTIVGILEQVPTLNEAPRSVPCPAAHVLELNAGYARDHGITPGQRIALEP